ncbi:MAG: restriction endonuclease [Ilumatobacteraceae bacterium]
MDETAESGPGWRAAEERVATLYRALGYTVTRDVLVQGSQIDLVAEQHLGPLGLIRIGVEVKDHPHGTLPIAEVREFAATSQLLTGNGAFHQMHLVTTGTVTKNSRQLVEPLPRTRLMSFEELERELFNPDAALGRWLDHYRSKPINKMYVEVQATLLDLDTPDDAQATGRLPSTSLLDVAVANPHLAIVVLADYGSGKSTMLERIKALAIGRRSEQPNAPVPVLLKLRDVSANFNVEQVVLDVVRSELGLDLPAETFWSLLGDGRFVMLLDGFDEITLRASETTRVQMLSGISPLLFSRSPAVLTSRPSYFASLEEYRTLLATIRSGRARLSSPTPNTQRVDRLVTRLADRYRETGPATPLDPHVATYRLDRLESSQIDHFLELASADLESVATSAQEVRSFLDSVYDLSDLISRPIILDMAVASIVEGHITPSQQSMSDGPAGLYEAYAQVQLERDWENVENRRNLLPYEVRMRFAEECALLMHRDDVLRVERADLAAVAKRAYPASHEHDIDEVLTDLRTCSFLTVDEQGNLEFIHRSYQEFFVARRIRHELEGKSSARLREPLRWEYIYFLGSMGFTDGRIYQEFFELSRARTPVGRDEPSTSAADNAAQALLVAREVARDLDWQGRRVARLRRPRVQIARSTLQAVELLGMETREVAIGDCVLKLRIDGASIGTLNLTNCTGAVEAGGAIGSIAAVGGKLDLSDQSTAQSLSFDAVELRLSARKGDKAVKFHTVTGHAELGPATVDAVRSELRLTLSGVMGGSVTESLLDLSLEGWECLAAELNRSIVVVSGRRAAQNLSTARRRIRKVTEDSPAGTGSVVVLDPSIPVDRWWPRQHRLVTIGADLGDAPAEFTGLFVHELPRPQASEPTEVLEVRQAGNTTLLIEGRGRGFDAARQRLSTAIQTARSRTVGDGTWLIQEVRPLLLDIGCAADAADEFIGLVRSRGDTDA